MKKSRAMCAGFFHLIFDFAFTLLLVAYYLLPYSFLKHPLIHGALPINKFFLLEPERNFAFASFRLI